MGLSEQVSQMRQNQADLKAGIVSLSERLAAKLTAMEEKIASLGEPDPDLSADVAELREMSDQINALAVDAPTDPNEPAPTDVVTPSPVEP